MVSSWSPRVSQHTLRRWVILATCACNVILFNTALIGESWNINGLAFRLSSLFTTPVGYKVCTTADTASICLSSSHSIRPEGAKLSSHLFHTKLQTAVCAEAILWSPNHMIYTHQLYMEILPMCPQKTLLDSLLRKAESPAHVCDNLPVTMRHSLYSNASVKRRETMSSGLMRNLISSWTSPCPVTPPPTNLFAKST